MLCFRPFRPYRSFRRSHFLITGALWLAMLYPLAVFAQQSQPPSQPQQKQQQQQSQQADTASIPTVQLPSFSELVKRYGDAVVNISTTRTVEEQGGGLPIPEGDPLFEFFRRFMPPPDAQEHQAIGMGSGFIIDQNGYVLTNAHLVAQSDEVSVKLVDKREFKAKVLGVDRYTDIALIKIEATSLPVVRIGTPEKLAPGDWVAAIGAPFGFENSITAGIVSAKGRMLPNETYVPFIQTDVAVNPGNSGGPLFNMRGEVVGINSQIYSRTGGFMGVSFAIPIDIAMDVAKELRATGKVTRSRIGVQVQEMTRELAASFGLKSPQGALVSMVQQGGPAEKGGLREGDIVLSMNGQPVQASADLARFVATSKPGTTIALEVWRKGQTVPIKVTTAEMSAPQEEETKQEGSVASAARAGLVVGDIPELQRRTLGIDHGVVVHEANGPAARAGIRPGDVIRSLNDTEITDASQLETLIEQNAGKTVALLVQRGADTMFLPLNIGGGAGSK